MFPVLELLGDQRLHPLADIRSSIAHELKLTDEELAARQDSGSQTLFANG
jgi:restriction endonuclease Mrr